MRKSKNTVSYSEKEIKQHVRQGKSRTNWKKIREMKAADIRAARKSDPDAAISPQPKDWDKVIVSIDNKSKEPLYMRVDADVLSWYKKHGKGYQTTINAVLRSYMQAHSTRPYR